MQNTISKFHALEQDFLKKKLSQKPLIGYLCLRVPPALIEAYGAVPKRITVDSGVDPGISNPIRNDGCSFCRTVPAMLKREPFNQVKAIIAGACCDQMRRLTEVIKNYNGIPTFFFPAPRSWNNDKDFFQSEMLKSFEEMGSMLGLKLKQEKLSELSETRFELNRLVLELREQRKLPVGLLHRIAQSPLPSEAITDFLNHYNSFPVNYNGIRVMLMGSIRSGKEISIIEEAGGNVVADATCLGDRAFLYPDGKYLEGGHSCPPEARTINPTKGGQECPPSRINYEIMDTLYDHYIENNTCPHRRPYTPLIDYARELAELRQVEGIIYRSVKFCHPYGLAAKRFKTELNLPFLEIDDDLTLNASSSFRTRIGAFMEMLQARTVKVSN